MTESCCQFGSNHRLSGILAQPEGQGSGTGVVLVTAGVLPKFGPFRLYAQLARRLALERITTLRFDLGGVGESLDELSDQPLRERTKLEISAAVDYLAAQRGVARVVLCGLCSGAEDSCRYAELDPRISGLVMIDPFSYRTSGWRARNLLHRVRRRVLRSIGLYRPLEYGATFSAPSGTPTTRKPLINYEYMQRAEAERILRTLVRRNASLHFIYTGGMHNSFNYADQLEAMFPDLDFKGRASVDHFPALEHTQMLESDRQLLLDAIVRRLKEH